MHDDTSGGFTLGGKLLRKRTSARATITSPDCHSVAPPVSNVASHVV
jgi:hypothetical protein